jgi:adenosylcobinamide-GDP ribazoletransferase
VIKLIKQLKALLSFLTIIPVKEEHDLKTIAEGIHLFPLIGFFTGILTGFIAYLISRVYPSLLTGIIAVSFLEFITGLHHFDALLDFGDGIMAKTTPEKKIEIMHDKQTGSGGFWLGITIIGIKIFSISQLHGLQLFTAIILSEISAKLSMVIGMWLGNPAYPSSTAVPFIEEAHKNPKKPLIALIFSLFIALLFMTEGILMIITSIIVAVIIEHLSQKHFKGITGDVLGSMDEITSALSLLVLVSII